MTPHDTHRPAHAEPLADALLRTRQALSALRSIDVHALSAAEHQRLSRLAASLADIAEELAGGMSAAEVRAIREEQEHCYLCGCHLPIRQRTLDHITPLAKGGLHVASNVKVACLSCNSSKRDEIFQKVLPEHSTRVAIGARNSASPSPPRSNSNARSFR